MGGRVHAHVCAHVNLLTLGWSLGIYSSKRHPKWFPETHLWLRITTLPSRSKLKSCWRQISFTCWIIVDDFRCSADLSNLPIPSTWSNSLRAFNIQTLKKKTFASAFHPLSLPAFGCNRQEWKSMAEVSFPTQHVRAVLCTIDRCEWQQTWNLRHLLDD